MPGCWKASKPNIVSSESSVVSRYIDEVRDRVFLADPNEDGLREVIPETLLGRYRDHSLKAVESQLMPNCIDNSISAKCKGQIRPQFLAL